MTTDEYYDQRANITTNVPSTTTNIRVHSECTSTLSAITDLIASQVVAVLVQQVGDLLHVDGVVERRRVTDLALIRGHLALQALD